jgi:hypothetical protein
MNELRKRGGFTLALGGLLAAGVLSLAACPPPVVMSVLTQQKDKVAPVITITFPSNNSSYPATLLVTGKATDLANGGALGKVASLRWDVTPATIPGQDVTSTLQADGSYSFTVPTATFSGTVLLTVTAADWDGNKATSTITLVNNGQVPSFTAMSGNHQVTLNWNTVPLAASYSIYYTTNGTPPSVSNGTRVDNVTSGYAVSGLQNGSLCSFLLQAHSSSGPDNWSNTIQSIPLSSLTLAPQVTTTQYGQVTVSWKGMAANTPVQVFRSLGSTPSGFFNLTGPISATSFVDYSVTPGQTYWYQVVPAAYSTVVSASASGMASTLGLINQRVVNHVTSSNIADVVAFSLNGSPPYYAATVDGSTDTVNIYDVTNDPAMKTVKFTAHPFGSTANEHALRICFDANDYLVVAGQDVSGHVLLGSVFFNGSSASTAGLGVGTASVTYQQVYDIKANNTYAFVADGYQGVIVFNYSSNRAAPTVASTYNPGAGYTDARSIAIDGSYIWLAAYNHGVNIFSLNNSTGAITAQTFSSGLTNIPNLNLFWPQAIALSGTTGGYLYVADAASGLVVIQFSITGLPSTWTFATLGTLVVPGTATQIAEDFTYGRTYIASYDQGLTIVNTGNPSNPSLFDSYKFAPGSFAGRVSISDKYAYAVDGGVEVIDPDTQIEFSYDLPYYAINGPAATQAINGADVRVQGTTAYVSTTSGLSVYNVASPTSPSPLGSAAAASANGGYMDVVGTNVYVAAGTSGLQIFDVSTPSTPALLGTYSFGGSEYARDVVLDGDYALLADNANGLLVVDVSTPSSPVLKAQYPAPSAAMGVKLVGTTLYLFDFTDMQILDVTDPTHPVFKGEWRTLTGVITGGDVVGNYAFVAAQGLVVLDVSNPLIPVQKGSSYPYNATPARVKVVGSFAFATSGAFGNPGGLQVYDITNPSAPVLKGFNYDVGSAIDIGLDVSGSYLFDAYDQGLKVWTLGYTGFN